MMAAVPAVVPPSSDRTTSDTSGLVTSAAVASVQSKGSYT